MATPAMVSLGFGKYVRADRIYALEPLPADERGSGARTRVWVEGIPKPVIASRTERAILAEMGTVPARPRPCAAGREPLLAAIRCTPARLVPAAARRHAAAPAPRLPQPLARPGDLDDRRRDRHRRRARTRSTSSRARRRSSACSGSPSLVPLLVVPLIGGAIADALDRRTVLLRTETGMALVTALFLVNALLPHPQVWALFVLQSLAVAVFSLGRPAMSSLAPRLVPDDEIAAAAALDGVYGSLARRRRARPSAAC